jgi:hypothetical protein
MRTRTASVSFHLSRGALAAALLLAVAVLPGRAAAQTCGDPDGTGAIDVIDAANVTRAAVGLPSTCAALPAACDLDGNGTIDVVDGANALRAAVGLPAILACVTEVNDFLAEVAGPGGARGVLDLGFAPIPGEGAPATIGEPQGETEVEPGGSNVVTIPYDTGMDGAQMADGELKLVIAIAVRDPEFRLVDGFFELPLDTPAGEVTIDLAYAAELGAQPFLLCPATRQDDVLSQYGVLEQVPAGGGQ